MGCVFGPEEPPSLILETLERQNWQGPAPTDHSMGTKWTTYHAAQSFRLNQVETGAVRVCSGVGGQVRVVDVIIEMRGQQAHP